MIEEISVYPPKTIGFRVIGKLTEEDYTRVLIPGIEREIEKFSKIGVLLQVENFQGWSVGGAWEDFKTWPKFRYVTKLAMVSDESWDEFMTWMLKVFVGFTHTELRFYRSQRIAEAWEWLSTGE
jgi:hypothetical protein